jgi:hypothetical protein
MKIKIATGCWVPVITPVIPATWRQRSGGLKFEASMGQIIPQDLILKTPIPKKGAGGVAQSEGPEFKPQYHKKKIATGFIYQVLLYTWVKICTKKIFKYKPFSKYILIS